MIISQIVIGAEGNTLTYILRGTETSRGGDQEAYTPGVLSCISERYFYLNWGAGGINVINEWGKLLLHWADPEYLPVYSLTVAGRGNNERWGFGRYSGE